MPFENKGEVVATTLLHPHGQIYAFPEIPPRPARELRAARRYRRETGRCVRCDVIGAEVSDGRRLVATTDAWAAWVPFWARFPYEVQVSPRRHVPALPGLDSAERDELAGLLALVTRSYDALWDFPMPYVMAIDRAARPRRARTVAEVSDLRVEFVLPYRSPTSSSTWPAPVRRGRVRLRRGPEATASALRAARDRLLGEAVRVRSWRRWAGHGAPGDPPSPSWWRSRWVMAAAARSVSGGTGLMMSRTERTTASAPSASTTGLRVRCSVAGPSAPRSARPTRAAPPGRRARPGCRREWRPG